MGEILTLDDLEERLEGLRRTGKTIVQSHGMFDLIHPGVVRHLEDAKKQGDVLIATVVSDRALQEGPVRPIFSEDLRLENAAALTAVDFVCLVDETSPAAGVRRLRPDVFAKGQPLTSAERQLPLDFLPEGESSETGTTGIYETIDLLSSSPTLLSTFLDIYSEETRAYLRTFSRRYSFEDVRRRLDEMRELTVMLVGDTIIDEYHFCRALGKSAKSNLVVNQYLGHEVHAGGALAIANHLAGLCREVRLVTLLGETDSREEFIRSHLRPNVVPTFFRRADGPTIAKKRYLDQYLNQKLFEVNYLNTQPIAGDLEASILGFLDGALPAADMVLVSDYGHGFITERIIRRMEQQSRALAVNTQNNGANVGYNMITKYRRTNFVCLDEAEIRWAAQDKESPIEHVAQAMAARLGCDCLITTLGKRGSVGITRGGGLDHTPIFSSKVVDTIGAGDAFFAFTAPSAIRGVPLDLVSFIGNAVGAIAVKIVGNRRPVEKGELLEFVATLLR